MQWRGCHVASSSAKGSPSGTPNCCKRHGADRRGRLGQSKREGLSLNEGRVGDLPQWPLTRSRMPAHRSFMTNAQQQWLARNREWQAHRAGAAYSQIGILDRNGRFQIVSATRGKNAIHLINDEILVGIPSR